MDLEAIREKIDGTDARLLELFIKRMELTEEVARYKSENNMPVFQRDREHRIIEKVKGQSPEELKKSAAFLFMNIMDISKGSQINKIGLDNPIEYGKEIKPRPSVAVQGTSGAYGDTAAKRLFPSGGNFSYYSSFSEVFEAAENGDVDYGVIPIENSTAGEVTVNMELLEKHKVYINRTVTVECAHVLAAKEGVSENEVKILFGHEQAIRQCSEYIEKRGDLTVIPYHNNASAAQMVSENPSNQLGCICSEECAEMHKLRIIRKGIASDPNNSTRFICVSKNIEVYDGAQTVAVSVSTPNLSGALYRLLAKFAVNGLNISKIQSKPLPVEYLRHLNEYMFYIEFSGNIEQDVVRKLLGNFESELNYYKFHGNF